MNQPDDFKLHHKQRERLRETLIPQVRREAFVALKSGAKFPREADLADRYGVSLGTMREVTLLLCHEGLLERHQGRGLFVKKTDRAPEVAVVLGMDLAAPRDRNYHRRVALQLPAELRKHGLRSRLYFPQSELLNDTEVKALPWPDFEEDARRGRLAGVIAMDGVVRASRVQQFAARHALPVVGILPCYTFSLANDFEAIRSGVRILARQNRRRIAFLSWRAPWDMGEDVEMAVFREAMAAAGLPVKEEWMCRNLPPDSSGAGWEEFREVWLARTERPDGLLVTDDVLFADIVPAIIEMGIRVPEQLEVVAHANAGVGHPLPFPAWRVVRNPDCDVRELADMIAMLIEGQTPTSPHRLVSIQEIRFPETVMGESLLARPSLAMAPSFVASFPDGGSVLH